MTESEERFLLLEYQQCSDNLRTFWNKRMAVLGVGITISGTLITEGVNRNFPVKYIYDLCLIVLLFVLIKILGSLTRPIALFTIRMKEISLIFNQKDFWTTWSLYVQKNSMDSGSATFFIICKFLNYTNLLYLTISHLLFIFSECETKNFTLIISSILTIIFVVIMTLINHKTLNNELIAGNVRNDVTKKWNEI